MFTKFLTKSPHVSIPECRHTQVNYDMCFLRISVFLSTMKIILDLFDMSFNKTWVRTEFSLSWQCISYYCDVYNCIFLCNFASSCNKENLQNPLDCKNLICAIACLSALVISDAKYSILSLSGLKFAWLIGNQHLSMNLVKLMLLEKSPIRIIDSCILSFDHMKIKFSFFRKILMWLYCQKSVWMSVIQVYI